ncbi:potassium-transporting ATPase subunit C [Candidatus Nitrosocosmicus arcticus]|nr:potassium-transporting ATPase subunit C [Candidatus Nitrosocosmicus arcticus]
MEKKNYEKENDFSSTNEKLTAGLVLYNLKTAIRVLVVMVIVLGIAYPVILTQVGQLTLPFQSGGSIVEFNGEKIGSKLIAQEFDSAKFFHPRPSSDSASTVDPHITPEGAYAQIKNVSEATGIHQNTLRTLLNLNIEQNKLTNAVFFAPQYVNVLEVNIELVNQYPEVYNMSRVSNSN